MAICKWPKAERPREKMLQFGGQALTDPELVAVLLGSGIAGRSAVEIARDLLTDYGSIRGLLNADWKRFRKKPGIGLARYSALQASVELARRYLRDPLHTRSVLATPDATQKFLIAQLRDRCYEVFCCLYLDARYRLISFEELFRGTVDTAGVYPREVLRQTLHHNATAVILAHNHPSGALEPSAADQHITQRIKSALALVDVRVVDHLIVGDGQCFSFSEHGLL